MTNRNSGIDRPPHPPQELRVNPPVGGGAFRPLDPSTPARRRDRSAHRAVCGLWEDLE
jgi:hypothetical protein